MERAFLTLAAIDGAKPRMFIEMATQLTKRLQAQPYLREIERRQLFPLGRGGGAVRIGLERLSRLLCQVEPYIDDTD
jgi:hypothetical protein